jgi:hypothetical protein
MFKAARGCDSVSQIFNPSAEPEKRSSIWNNLAIRFLWFLVVLILGIFAVALYILFFLLFGASYEIINCYLDDRNRKHEEEDENNNVANHRGSSFNFNISDISQSSRKKEVRRMSVNDEPLTNREYTIIGLLVAVGILLQPFYLMLKVIEIMMECYRKFGCWFYFYSSY